MQQGHDKHVFGTETSSVNTTQNLNPMFILRANVWLLTFV